ncbi:MAG: DUF86 domain-containing protein [Thermomicrobiales bacterium]
MPPDIVDVLEHIQEEAENIAEDTAGLTYDAFMADRRRRYAVERSFLTIGEAVRRLRRHAPDIAERLTDHDAIVAFRNALIHEYDDISYPSVWRAVQVTLPV